MRERERERREKERGRERKNERMRECQCAKHVCLRLPILYIRPTEENITTPTFPNKLLLKATDRVQSVPESFPIVWSEFCNLTVLNIYIMFHSYYFLL